MKCLVIIAVTGCLMMVAVGCAQGAGNPSSGSKDLSTSAARSDERATTAEQTTSHKEVYATLQCTSNAKTGGTFEYAPGPSGAPEEQVSPVEQVRQTRRFAKHIKEGDTVEIADRPRAPNQRVVVVVRDGRVVARFDYGRVGGSGWRLGDYKACIEFWN